MHWQRTLGVLAVGVAFAGYGAGLLVPYPGRAFSLTLGMAGLTLVAMGGEGA